jgi:pimeloyl-ACP methyl ester carboxylesterase
VRLWGDWSHRHPVPLLCLPGLSRNSLDFAGLARAVAPYPVAALDPIGRGLADRAADSARYSPPRLLDDIRHVTAALGLHKAIGVGTSFGGLLAMALAVSQPGLLAGTIINDVGPDAATSGASIWLDIVGNPPEPADWPEALAYLKGLMPDLSIETEDGWRELAEATFEMRPDVWPGLQAQWDPRLVEPLRTPSDAFDLWAVFRAAAARGPMLIVHGGASNVLSAETLAEMQRQAPSAEAVTLPNIGHAPTLTEPPVLDAIRRLLARVSG